MIAVAVILWVLGILLTFGAVVVSILATQLRRPALGLVALAPVGIGVLLLAFGIGVPLPGRAFWVLLAIAIAALGIAAGNPITVFVLHLATPKAMTGDNGGIVVGGPARGTSREVLRGGTIIGYLERLAIVAGIAVGHPEVVAAVIAIKGLGRFSELDSPEARERFIIGTLVSMIWGAACGGLIVLGGGLLP